MEKLKNFKNYKSLNPFEFLFKLIYICRIKINFLLVASTDLSALARNFVLTRLIRFYKKIEPTSFRGMQEFGELNLFRRQANFIYFYRK
jgi:hypothetical protein